MKLMSMATSLAIASLSIVSAISSDCSTSGDASCQIKDPPSKTCCTEYPGGLLLQTQFWDTNPPTGPKDSFTIHGLWSDNCDTTFLMNCDPSRDYTDISTLLVANGASDTLDFMNQFWVDIHGKNEEFWESEWATHGTCMSTLVPSCLPIGSPTGAEAVAYFQTAVELFKTLPTYTFLSNAGITPSSSTTYTLSQMLSALKNGSGGFTPAINCHGSTLAGISWYFNLKGSILDGMFIPIDAPSAATDSCPSSGIKYPLKDK